jgi:hypothetical protein
MQKLKIAMGFLRPCANTIRIYTRFFLVIFSLSFFNFSLSAQVSALEEMYSSDGYLNDSYGTAVDIYGDYMAVGADFAGVDDQYSAGAVYVYTKDENGEWGDEQIITASDGQNNVHYGSSLSIYEDQLAVGAWERNTIDGIQVGRVYVYTRDENGVWGDEVILTPSDVSAYQAFGFSVDLYDNQLAIGASGDGEVEDFSGAVYLYTKDESGQWGNETKIKSPNPVEWGVFGITLAIQDDYLAVRQFKNHSVGSVFIYTRDALGVWTLQQEILGYELFTFNFGKSLSFSGDYLAISSAMTNDYNIYSYSGPVMLFKKGPDGLLEFQQEVSPPSSNLSPNFGYSISLSDDVLAVCDNKALVSGQTDGGAVYIYTKDENDFWTYNFEITPENPGSGDEFGSSVKVFGEDILIGSIGRDGNYSNSGTVFVSSLFESTTSTQAVEGNEFKLHQNFPNPSRGETTIAFELNEAGKVELSVLDLSGKVLHKTEGNYGKGLNKISIKDLNIAGIYYYTLTSGGFTATKKMIVTE